MLVQSDNNMFSVVWRYDTIPLSAEEIKHHDGLLMIRSKKSKKINPTKIVTTCIVREGTGKEAKVLTEGKAYCGVKDQFCRNCGRKVAMHRALCSIDNFSKDVRRIFWEAYAQMRGGSFV